MKVKIIKPMACKPFHRSEKVGTVIDLDKEQAEMAIAHKFAEAHTAASKKTAVPKK